MSQPLPVGGFRCVRFDSGKPLEVVDYLSRIKDHGYLVNWVS